MKDHLAVQDGEAAAAPRSSEARSPALATDKPATRTAFEAYMRKRNPCVRLARQQEYLGGHYRTTTVQRAWELWLAASATAWDAA
jgi:hypothetical protein